MEKLKPLLAKGDIVIDGGNSWFEDTQRRDKTYTAAGLNFFGMGVSGGEDGARFGPSMMPGGNKAAWEHAKPALEAISAKTDSGPCVTYVGPDGAGHCVKMVHNGIEYADMQLIAEAYDILHRGLGMSTTELADTFAAWNKGPLNSFLIEITAKILTVNDKDGKPLLDKVLDKAGQKGTGLWTNKLALSLGVPVPTIAAAVDSRILSSMKEERTAASKTIPAPPVAKPTGDKKDHVAAIHDALLAAKVVCYAQGMRLIRDASDKYNWNINLGEMARIWKGGCIIRSTLLDSIMKAFERNPKLPNLVLDETFNQLVREASPRWRQVVGMAQNMGLPVPAMSSALSYYDAYRTERLPQNMTQAQRDAFGAHTYQTVSNPSGPFVHSEWLK
jgi:6-phosphogluconate dehydrogenase